MSFVTSIGDSKTYHDTPIFYEIFENGHSEITDLISL